MGLSGVTAAEDDGAEGVIVPAGRGVVCVCVLMKDCGEGLDMPTAVPFCTPKEPLSGQDGRGFRRTRCGATAAAAAHRATRQRATGAAAARGRYCRALKSTANPAGGGRAAASAMTGRRARRGWKRMARGDTAHNERILPEKTPANVTAASVKGRRVNRTESPWWLRREGWMGGGARHSVSLFALLP